MIVLIVFSGIFLLLLCLLLWKAYHRLTAGHTGELSARLPVDFLVPRKPEEFRRARENLRMIEAQIGKEHLLTAEKWRLLRERNKLARELLIAIHEDFIRLDRLMCAVAVVSPEVSREKEFKRLWLSLRFAARYRMALLGIALGAQPAQSIAGLQILAQNKAQSLRAQLTAVDSAVSANFGTLHSH
jgi:hypothetical protein